MIRISKKEQGNLWLLLTGFYLGSILSYIVDNSIPMGIFAIVCFALLLTMMCQAYRKKGRWSFLFPLKKLLGHFTKNKQTYATSQSKGNGEIYNSTPIIKNTKCSEENANYKTNKKTCTHLAPPFLVDSIMAFLCRLANNIRRRIGILYISTMKTTTSEQNRDKIQ